jgi:hypothetical protein
MQALHQYYCWFAIAMFSKTEFAKCSSETCAAARLFQRFKRNKII